MNSEIDFTRRRSRRGRGRHHGHNFELPNMATQSKLLSPYILNAMFSLLVLSSLITLIYFMLEHHCNVCKAKCELGNLTNSVEDISASLQKLNVGYQEMEMKVASFSAELPKIQHQLIYLESIANAAQMRECSRRRPHCVAPIPNMDILFKNDMNDKLNQNRNHWQTANVEIYNVPEEKAQNDSQT